jgi:hypothetical protein
LARLGEQIQRYVLSQDAGIAASCGLGVMERMSIDNPGMEIWGHESRSDVISIGLPTIPVAC